MQKRGELRFEREIPSEKADYEYGLSVPGRVEVSETDTMFEAMAVPQNAGAGYNPEHFFDPVLFKFAANVPSALRMRDNKYVLREAARPYLPDFALERPKQHFNSPILGWFDNELSGNIREVLLDPNGFIYDLFNRAELEQMLKDHLWGRTSQVEVVFRLLTLELWGQAFIKPAVFSGQQTTITHQ